MKRKQQVLHKYTLRVESLSAWGKAKAILDALEPHKYRSHYGYNDVGSEVDIWWRTEEEF